MNCSLFRQSIYHFQADEMTAEDRGRMEQHLDECPPCARLLEVEDGFLRALKSRLEPTPATPGLETRVRAALDSEALRRRPRGWLGSPGLAAAAASVVLAVVLLLGLGGELSPVEAGAIPVEREVMVVDLDCDRAGKPVRQQRKCMHRRHLNALKLRDGTYWHPALDDSAYRGLAFDRDMRGHRLLVSGKLYPAIGTVRVERARELDREL
ncbi:MAG: hypothetical protein GY716_05145 [bacterium]|nr:hypothetical protein [bacterium]